MTGSVRPVRTTDDVIRDLEAVIFNGSRRLDEGLLRVAKCPKCGQFLSPVWVGSPKDTAIGLRGYWVKNQTLPEPVLAILL